MRFLLILVTFAFLAGPRCNSQDLDTGFTELGELKQPAATGFKYKLSIRPWTVRGYVMRGHWNGVSTKATGILLTGESFKRTAAKSRHLHMKSTSGSGRIDIVPLQEYMVSARPDFTQDRAPDRPEAAFRCELRSLILVDDESRVRIRFKDSIDYFKFRYEDGTGLRLEALSPEIEIADGMLPDFRVIKQSKDEYEYYSNPLTTWAMDGDKLLWSIDLPMEGQPDTMKVLDKVVFVTTTAGHSFYLLRDAGTFAFYDESIMPGIDPVGEVLKLGRQNMKFMDKRSRLEKFITASVVLDDPRTIPFLIDCIEKGFGLQPRAMAIAALEKFNGNPDLWGPKNPKPGSNPLGVVGMHRVYPKEKRDAEIAKWREVFADELAKYNE